MPAGLAAATALGTGRTAGAAESLQPPALLPTIQLGKHRISRLVAGSNPILGYSYMGAHAEGDGTTADGYASHAEGEETTASGLVIALGSLIPFNSFMNSVAKVNLAIGAAEARRTRWSAFALWAIAGLLAWIVWLLV